MIGLAAYLKYANWQKRELSSIEGIVIYDDSSIAIPAYVVFIPVTFEKGKEVKQSLEETLLRPNPRAYIIYFQAIRWILPDLADIVKSLNYIKVNYGGLYLSRKVSYGKFTFDKTLKGDESIPTDNTITRVPVQIDDKVLFLYISELTDDMGTPKLFEKID
jgi:hypothetical protein